MDLREELIKAGNLYDGNATNGSIEEQLKVVQDWFAHPEKYADDQNAANQCLLASHKTYGDFKCMRPVGHKGPCMAFETKSVLTFIREEN